MKFTSFDFKYLSIIFIFNLLLKLPRLNVPAGAFFDEGVHFVPAARDYLQGVFETEPTHPMLGKLFISAGIHLFGDNAWGWRIPEVLIGSIGVIFIYLLAKSMFGGRLIPVLASIFLTFEFSWFVHSRVGVIEVYAATFSLAGAFFFWQFLKTDKKLTLIFTGIFFGLAIASKWSSLFLLLFVGLYYIFQKRESFSQSLYKVILISGSAVVVYLAAFIFYLQKHSLAELFQLQINMFTFHASEHPEIVADITGRRINKLNYYYSPLTWLFNTFQIYAGSTDGVYSRIITHLYNPALFWGSITAIVLSIKRLNKNREKLFLIGSFLVFWVPWLIIPRISYPYYLLSSMPFGIILLSKILEENFEMRSFLVVGFTILAVLIFLFYYPVLSFLNVPNWYIRILTGSFL